MEEKYLPLGTIVLLKNAKHRAMIIGYAIKDEKDVNKIYDYLGCLYPEGVISSTQNLVFNHEKIDKVLVMGHSDEEWKKLTDYIKSEVAKRNN